MGVPEEDAIKLIQNVYQDTLAMVKDKGH